MFPVFVGTSGWSYGWNPDGLDWYVTSSGLNTVELNASFYRLPQPRAVSAWGSKTPPSFRWAVKVNRLVTHVFRFDERALEVWSRFNTLFEPLSDRLDFYLFQLPPSFTPNPSTLEKLERFIQATGLAARFALECRNSDWFKQSLVYWAEKLGITVVSVDSPNLPRFIFNVNGVVYLRMHGRTFWYSHSYGDGELIEVANKLAEALPERAYIYFNNNHDMLVNARRMLEILSKLGLYPDNSHKSQPQS